MGDHGRLRLLFVDDSRFFREAFIASFGGPGSLYDIVEAEDAEQALDILARDSVDAALVDLLLPRMTGTELVERMRADERYASLPIVMMSTSDASALAQIAQEAGADGFIPKPFDLDGLHTVLDAALSAREVELPEPAGACITAQAMLESIPHIAMIVDENHEVVMANDLFYEATGTGIGECRLHCVSLVHGGRGAPPDCPLRESARTGRPVEREIGDTVLGRALVSVYPIDATVQGRGRVYLHIARPVGAG